MSYKILNNRQIEILQQFDFGKQYSITEIINQSKDLSTVSLATIKRDFLLLKNSQYIFSQGEKRGMKYSLTEYGLIHRPYVPHVFLSEQNTTRGKLVRFTDGIFSILERVEIFSRGEIELCNTATKNFHNRAKGVSDLIHQKELERFVIELSWKSSKIEGNTYTILDTERLIREGIPAEGKTKDETVMILNHKKAFDYILEIKQNNQPMHLRQIENIHRILVEGLGVAYGARKGAVGITGSDYMPLELHVQIQEQFENLVNLLQKKQDPYTQALLAVVGISYLQPFEDGNKRTARLIANAFLLLGDCAPLSYRNVDEKDYREALLVFYEQNSIEPFKQIFIEQYLFACENYNIG